MKKYTFSRKKLKKISFFLGGVKLDIQVALLNAINGYF